MSEDTEELNTNDSSDGVLATIENTIGELATSIPAPIRKNALKAFARLCSAGIEYPVVLIENAINEKKAESEARVKLIKTSGNQIAEQMKTDSEYANVAVAKFAQKILREQVNLDKVAIIAAEELKSKEHISTDKNEIDAPPISEDWLNAFEREAVQMSSEEMQRLFGKILAGEITKPTSFSIKTIKLLAQLDNSAAELFRKFCSCSISLRVGEANKMLIIDARTPSLGNPGHNSLQQYGFNFDNLNKLEEYGLIISEYNTYSDYKLSVFTEKTPLIPLTYLNERWILIPKDKTVNYDEFRLDGVKLSNSGKELLPIVEVTPNDEYTQALVKDFEVKGLTLSKID